MKAGWEVAALGALYDITSSKRVLQSDWRDNGVPFYRAREIAKLAEFGVVDNELFISEEQFDRFSKKFGHPKEGDLMVTGVGTLGRCYMVRPGDRFYFKDASVLWLKRKKEVCSEFIRYAFETALVKNQINSGTGATVGTYTIARALNTEIPLPPLEEQKRIVAVLDEAFEGLDRARANAEANLADARELLDAEVDRAILGSGPDWVTCSLAHVCNGFEYGTSEKSEREGRVAVLRMGNLQGGALDWRDLVFSSNEADIKKLSLQPMDVLFNRTNSLEHVGKSAIYRGERSAIFAGYLIRVHYKPEVIDPEFLNMYLNTRAIRAYGRTVAGKSVNQANISAGKLKNYPFAYPSIEEQGVIVQRLNELRANVENVRNVYEARILQIDQLRQSLLQKAFSGELT